MSTDVSVTLGECTCCACGCVFGLSATHEAKLRESHATFYCPNGHPLHYKAATEAEKLAKQLAAERAAHDQTKAARDDLSRAVDARDRQLAARKGQITKIKNRVGRGVCPCCNRYFANLHAHMLSKHPDYQKSGEEKA